ncbi:MAG: hypothetical protein PVH22_11770 [Desulfobacteraceae bacterium]|jgi:hypothetical protein
MFGNLSGPQAGYIGGLLGCMIGIAGGAFGTYCSIKNTKGPLEKRFMIRTSMVTWVALLIFLGLLIYLPTPYRFIMWIPYGILLPVGIRYINKRQGAIRAMEDSPDFARQHSRNRRNSAPHSKGP